MSYSPYRALNVTLWSWIDFVAFNILKVAFIYFFFFLLVIEGNSFNFEESKTPNVRVPFYWREDPATFLNGIRIYFSDISLKFPPPIF